MTSPSAMLGGLDASDARCCLIQSAAILLAPFPSGFESGFLPLDHGHDTEHGRMLLTVVFEGAARREFVSERFAPAEWTALPDDILRGLHMGEDHTVNHSVFIRPGDDRADHHLNTVGLVRIIAYEDMGHPKCWCCLQPRTTRYRGMLHQDNAAPYTRQRQCTHHEQTDDEYVGSATHVDPPFLAIYSCETP